MYYIIDGYNLIFSLIDSKHSLKTLRGQIIAALQKRFSIKKISGMLVFDGSHRKEEETGLTYSSPLIIAYAPKGQTADEYIVHQIELARNPKLVTVITNDKGLARHAKSAGAHIQRNEEFIEWLHKKKKKNSKIEPKETQQNMDRLLKIFEERLNHPD